MSAEDDELPNLVDDAPTATTGEEEELDSDDDVSTLAPEDRLARALAAKDKGNGAFKAKDEAGAVKEYKYGVGMLEGLNEANTGEEQVKALLLSLHNNLSMVHFKLGEYGEATKQGSAALTIDPQNVKGLYRRGAARRKAGELKEAKADLSACLKLDAANKEAKAQLRGVLKDLEEEKKKYAGFLGKGGGLYGDREKERAQRDQEKKVAAATKKRQEVGSGAPWTDRLPFCLVAGSPAFWSHPASFHSLPRPQILISIPATAAARRRRRSGRPRCWPQRSSRRGGSGGRTSAWSGWSNTSMCRATRSGTPKSRCGRLPRPRPKKRRKRPRRRRRR